MAVRRRAAAHHRDPARAAPPGSAVRRACSPTTTWPGSASARASSTSGCPRRCIEEAEELGMPLFEVPYEMPFIAITERAFALSGQRAVRRCCERGTQVHERLERLVIEGRGLDEPCSARWRARSAASAIVQDSTGRELARHPSKGGPERGGARRRSASELARAGPHRGGGRVRATASRRWPAARWRCPSPAGAAAPPVAWLIVVSERRPARRVRAADRPAGRDGGRRSS